MRYLIEGVFGNIKLKLGSKFALIREDLALKRALAVFALYALNLIFFQFVILPFFKIIDKDLNNFLMKIY